MRKIIILFFFTLFSATAEAQLVEPITWSHSYKKVSKTEAIIYIKAKLSGNWHLYAQDVGNVAMKLKFRYQPTKNYTLIGKTIGPKPIRKYDSIVNMQLAYFENQVVFQQRIRLAKSSASVKLNIEFMVCNDKSCLPADEITLNIPIKP